MNRDVSVGTDARPPYDELELLRQELDRRFGRLGRARRSQISGAASAATGAWLDQGARTPHELPRLQSSGDAAPEASLAMLLPRG
jgi:hypothetical protein